MQVIFGFHQLENRKCAIIPPLVTDDQRFLSNAGFENLVQYPFAVLKEHQLTCMWEDQETSSRSSSNTQRNFNIIASYLDKKSVADYISITSFPRRVRPTSSSCVSHAH
ncbi:hypothetical protein HPB48_012308 [Haemaphysalis longicornis]|uniref:Uncharacterized protein n=1 Tax=Haemaphysalis longicornis TaxID=44386 RepID=A0A9J6GM59_HAELO|nr:hypothetical protein HPB48_012308 [Haemaphysalis longicornis]